MEPKPGKINLLSRPLGVELEFSILGRIQHHCIPQTQWVHDGTITSGGAELVCNPVVGDGYVKLIDHVIDQIEANGVKADKTCGFHVHCQSTDLGWFGLRRALLLWNRIEGDVFRYFTQADRQRNRYCQPMNIVNEADRRECWQFSPESLVKMMRPRYHSEDSIKRWLLKHLYGLEIPKEVIPMPVEPSPGLAPNEYNKQYTIWRKKYSEWQKLMQGVNTFEKLKKNKRTETNGCRYAAFNVHSHFYRGTIEFRLKEGTTNYDEIVFWPLVCGWIVESVMNLTDVEVGSIHGVMDWMVSVKGFVQPGVLKWMEEKINGKR
jgi:hypothetical protein